jgi:hypothetical protein
MTLQPHPVYKEYLATEDGRVWNSKSNRFISSSSHHTGYLVVNIKKRQYRAHRFILECFLKRELKMGYYVNHIDGNKQNNCIINLEECTSSENSKHAFKLGLREARKGELNGNFILPETTVRDIIRDIRKGLHNDELASKYKVEFKHISLIRHKKRWKHLFEEDEFKNYKPINSCKPVGYSLNIKLEVIKLLSTTKLKLKEIATLTSIDPSIISRVNSKQTWLNEWNLYLNQSSETILKGSTSQANGDGSGVRI